MGVELTLIDSPEPFAQVWIIHQVMGLVLGRKEWQQQQQLSLCLIVTQVWKEVDPQVPQLQWDLGLLGYPEVAIAVPGLISPKKQETLACWSEPSVLPERAFAIWRALRPVRWTQLLQMLWTMSKH